MKTLAYTKPSPSLGFCLLMDLVGCISFAVPALGEFTDILWAPISAIIFFRSFGGRLGTFGAMLDFAEEALPFTDIIPTFTIAWFIKKYF